MCVLDKKSYLTEALRKGATSHTKGQVVEPSVTTTARKVIEDGKIYIIHNGIRYNALGTQIK